MQNINIMDSIKILIIRMMVDMEILLGSFTADAYLITYRREFFE